MTTQTEPCETTAAYWDGQGQAYAMQSQYEAAIVAFDKAIALNPNYAAAWNHRGSALASSKRYAAAFASYDQAVAIAPLYHQAWFNRGLLLTEMGAYGTAVESYDRAIALEPDQVYLHAREDIFLKRKLIPSLDPASGF